MTRKEFLRTSVLVSGALLVGFDCIAVLPEQERTQVITDDSKDDFHPNAYVQVAPGGVATVLVPRPELGQGAQTALAMLVAEELDIEWKDVRVVSSPIAPALMQVAGASTAITHNYSAFRRAGAMARALLLRAAALRWRVRVNECETESGQVVHRPSGRRLRYSELVSTARTLSGEPSEPIVLKPPSAFRLLGRRVPAIDQAKICRGEPLFGIDQKLPGMLHAIFVKCPQFGGKVRNANLDRIKALPGVRHAFVVDGTAEPNGLQPGVAIVADSTWAAFQARKLAVVKWDVEQAENDNWSALMSEAERRGSTAKMLRLRQTGSVEALGSASTIVRAKYVAPFLAHATMEPQNCTAHFSEGRLRIVAPSQDPAGARRRVARTFGLPLASIDITMVRCGGAFGRRLGFDYVLEAVAIALRIPEPVKLTWSREDDLQHDHYRPPVVHFLKGSVDRHGKILAWHDRVVVFGNSPMKPAVSAGMDPFEFPSGFVDNFLLEGSIIACQVPMGPLRSFGCDTRCFAIQSFIDELAHGASVDPLQMRLTLLSKEREVPAGSQTYSAARMSAVLRAVAEKSSWGRAMSPGSAQGLAFHFAQEDKPEYFNQSYAAVVAEVAVSGSGELKVTRFVVAVDAGEQIVNLSSAESQVQGAVLDGYSAALRQQAVYRDGRMQLENFQDYPLLRISEAPPVEVNFVSSPHEPSGLGECALPPVAPAVCNAIFRATGKRIRELPISTSQLV